MLRALLITAFGPSGNVVAFPHKEVTVSRRLHCCTFVARGCFMTGGVLPDQDLEL